MKALTFDDKLNNAVNAVNCIDKYTCKIRAHERDRVVDSVYDCSAIALARQKESASIIQDQNSTILFQSRQLRRSKRELSLATRELQSPGENAKPSSSHLATQIATFEPKCEPTFSSKLQKAMKAAESIDKYTCKIRAHERDNVIACVKDFATVAISQDKENRKIVQQQAKTIALQLAEMKQINKELTQVTEQLERIRQAKQKSLDERRKSFLSEALLFGDTDESGSRMPTL